MQLEPLEDLFTFIGPADARKALETLRTGVTSFDIDMRNAVASGKMPAAEGQQWAQWRQQFEQYYNDHTTDWLASWRNLGSAQVFAAAEKMAADLTAWRIRYESIIGAPATAAPGLSSSTNVPMFGPAAGAVFTLAAIMLGVYIARK